jgi:hypothetical protein
MSGNRKGTARKKRTPVVKGIPGGDCDSCLDWLLANISQKTKGCRAKIGDIARHQLTILLDGCIRALLEHALPLREKDATMKEWGGRVLARLHVTLEAHQWKLKRENPAYREGKAKWEKTRANVLIPESEISKMVQEELRAAESYQLKLFLIREYAGESALARKAVEEREQNYLVWHCLAVGDGRLWTPSGIKAIERHTRSARPPLPRRDDKTAGSPSTWQEVAQNKGVPSVYWPIIDLPRFCATFADLWWDWLWAHILKDKEVLLPGRDPSKVQRQIHDYFLALVDARESGTF